MCGLCTRAAQRKTRSSFSNLTFPKPYCDRGPYRYIRHPFYASYILFWLGCAIATLHPVNVGYFLVLVPVYVISALKEEKGFEQSPSAADYKQYRQTAGLFWPKFR